MAEKTTVRMTEAFANFVSVGEIFVVNSVG